MRVLLSAALALSVVSSSALAGGSPKAFKKYLGDYDGTGKFKSQTALQTNVANLESDADLEMASDGKSAIIEVASAGTLAGQSTTARWQLTFKRKNACVIDIAYPSGAIGRVEGKYEVKRGQVTFSGPLQVRTGSLVLLGSTTGKVRFASNALRLVQRDTLATTKILARQKLTKESQ